MGYASCGNIVFLERNTPVFSKEKGLITSLFALCALWNVGVYLSYFLSKCYNQWEFRAATILLSFLGALMSGASMLSVHYFIEESTIKDDTRLLYWSYLSGILFYICIVWRQAFWFYNDFFTGLN